MGPKFASSSDIDPYLDHHARHSKESGRDGGPLFSALPPDHQLMRASARADLRQAWTRSLREPAWQRAWVIYDENLIIAEASLRAPTLATSLHRATLGIGVEQKFRGRGLGTQLIQTAIDWARKDAKLSYIDLQVFEENSRAQKLYRKIGFREVGRFEDRYRIGGQKINELALVLVL